MNDPRPELPDAAQWYYLLGDEACGPVTGSHLRRLISVEQIPGSTLVWREGMLDWLPASELGMMSSVVPVPPPIVPSQPSGAVPVRPGRVGFTHDGSPTPRRPRVTRSRTLPSWFWMGIAATCLLMAGIAIGYVLQSRSTDDVASGNGVLREGCAGPITFAQPAFSCRPTGHGCLSFGCPAHLSYPIGPRFAPIRCRRTAGCSGGDCRVPFSRGRVATTH